MWPVSSIRAAAYKHTAAQPPVLAITGCCIPFLTAQQCCSGLMQCLFLFRKALGYTYDGLYNVHSATMEVNEEGFLETR